MKRHRYPILPLLVLLCTGCGSEPLRVYTKSGLDWTAPEMGRMVVSMDTSTSGEESETGRAIQRKLVEELTRKGYVVRLPVTEFELKTMDASEATRRAAEVAQIPIHLSLTISNQKHDVQVLREVQDAPAIQDQEGHIRSPAVTHHEYKYEARFKCGVSATVRNVKTAETLWGPASITKDEAIDPAVEFPKALAEITRAFPSHLR